MKKGVLLINLGTPDSPEVNDVRRYLSQFLNDPYVIDISPLARFFLVNFIIVPFRARKSAALYKEIWTEKGSPLLYHGLQVKDLLQKSLGETYKVVLGMRYQKPSLSAALEELKKACVSEIIAIPLYPQYAMSSTKSSIEEVKRLLKKGSFPPVKFVEKFYDDDLFLEAFADIARKYDPAGYDHVVFSYHGLPERQITKESSYCRIDEGCCSVIGKENRLCYRAGCFETTRRLAALLNIPKDKYTIAFQSRLDDKWLKPYSDKVIEEKARQGLKRILVFSPAFVADCLETIYEIGTEYKHIFQNAGGVELTMVESLNDYPTWIRSLHRMVAGR